MARRKSLDFLVLFVAAAFLSTKGPGAIQDEVTGLTGELDRIPEAVAAAGVTLASAAGVDGVRRDGRHLGFDTYQYPGDEIMKAWQRATPYEWVGYYLPAAPCHKGTTWSGKRERLQEMGWGLAVIYVGQQTWGGTPRDYVTTYKKKTRYVTVKKRVRQRYTTKSGKRAYRYVTRRVRQKRTSSVPVRSAFNPAAYDIDQCHRNLPSSARGTMEGKDAIATTIREGFPDGTVIFLDLEYMPHVPQRYRDYYVAWTSEVLADGRFTPGYYVHKSNAELIHEDVSRAFAAAGRTDAPNFWVAGGRDFHHERQPHEIGLQFATAWQGKLDIKERWAGYRLPIDVNVASTSSPSLAAVIPGAVAD